MLMFTYTVAVKRVVKTSHGRSFPPGRATFLFAGFLMGVQQAPDTSRMSARQQVKENQNMEQHGRSGVHLRPRGWGIQRPTAATGTQPASFER